MPALPLDTIDHAELHGDEDGSLLLTLTGDFWASCCEYRMADPDVQHPLTFRLPVSVARDLGLYVSDWSA